MSRARGVEESKKRKEAGKGERERESRLAPENTEAVRAEKDNNRGEGEQDLISELKFLRGSKGQGG